MSSVDDRVVNMRFNNSAFERGARTTLSTLDKLKHSLSFSGQKNGLEEVQKSANKFSMGGIDQQVDQSTRRWSAWRTAGLIAFATIVHQAVRAGERVLASFTIDPVKAGFENYETQINAVQTILANTGLKGKKGLGQVNAALSQLNTYANQTVYNFSEMARNIGTFTAAGVDLKTSTASIKGIANLAALSGSNSQQASTAMYQLSQAIAANQVKLQDWNSVVNAGMGGKVFQRALFNTGKALHTIKDVPLNMTFDQWTKAGNSFRGSLQDGWITGKVLTQTLEGFTGDLTDAQLKSMGYNAEQIKQIREMGQTAVGAATKIKTFSQLTQALKEEVATAYGSIFKTIFGDINSATELFSKAHIVLENTLTAPIYALNNLLEGVTKLGGRKVLIQAFSKAWNDLADVVFPIKKAFRDIFPAKSAKDIYNLIVRFRDFMNTLALGEDTMDNIRRTARGVFAVFDIIGQVLSGVWHLFVTLFTAVHGGNEVFLNFTGNVGDMLVAFDKALKNGNGLTTFFSGLAKILEVPLHLLGSLAKIILGLFDGFNTTDVNGVSESLTVLGGAMGNLAGMSDRVSAAWDRVVAAFAQAKQRMQPLIDNIKKLFGGIGQTISDTLGSSNFDDILKLFNTVLLGGITLAIRKFLGKGISVDIGHGFLSKIGEGFEQLTGTLKAAQTQLKAKALLEIGAAVALLTGSVLILSTIDPKKLNPAIQSLAILFTQLLIGMGVLTKISGAAGFLKLPAVAASMVLMSGAILILVVALKSLAKLDWEALKKGLVGVGILLGELTAAVTIMSLASGNMARTSAGIIALALAVKILASAVKDFSKMSWKEMIKGLSGVAISLIAIAAAMRLMPPKLALQGAGLLAIGIGLEAISVAVNSFAKMGVRDLAKGLIGVAGALNTISASMHLMPKKGMVAQAAALLLIGIALQGIASAVAKMGAIDWKTMGHGLLGIAAALLILAGGLHLMEDALPGAIALGVTAASMSIMAGVLKTLGNMSWSEIIKGLVGVAGTFAIIGIASAALEPVSPAIIALGIALLAFGAAVALFGAGIDLLGHGFEALARGGTQGVAILLKALDGFIERIPKMAKALANGLVGFVTIIGKNGPAMVKGLAGILESLMQAIIRILPTALRLFTRLIATFLQAVVINTPRIVAAGGRIIVSILNGIAGALPRVIRAAANVVIAFIRGIGDNIGRVIDAGFKFVIKFLNGIADALRKNEGQVINAAVNVGIAMMQGFYNGIQQLAGRIWDNVTGWFHDLWNDITDFFDIFSPSKKMAWAGQMLMLGFGQGIDKHGNVPSKAMHTAAVGVVTALNNALDNVPNGIDINPTISPVLDLTNVQKDASKIPGLLSATPITANTSFTTAASVSAASQAAQNEAANAETAKDAAPREVKFEQTNISPKALSPIEIYRQTRNQLALAKEVLTKT